MEATCQHIDYKYEVSDEEVPRVVNARDDGLLAVVCGAPIPRLDEGPCEHRSRQGRCLSPKWVVVHRNDSWGHAYLGPLASECANGHPVAVQTCATCHGPAAADGQCLGCDRYGHKCDCEPVAVPTEAERRG